MSGKIGSKWIDVWQTHWYKGW